MGYFEKNAGLGQRRATLRGQALIASVWKESGSEFRKETWSRRVSRRVTVDWAHSTKCVSREISEHANPKSESCLETTQRLRPPARPFAAVREWPPASPLQVRWIFENGGDFAFGDPPVGPTHSCGPLRSQSTIEKVESATRRRRLFVAALGGVRSSERDAAHSRFAKRRGSDRARSLEV